jgi:hypothetical protein
MKNKDTKKMKSTYKVSEFFPENPWVSFNDWIGIMKIRSIYSTGLMITHLESLIYNLSDIEDFNSLELAKKEITKIIYDNLDLWRERWRGSMEQRWSHGDENFQDVVEEFNNKTTEYYSKNFKMLNDNALCFTSILSFKRIFKNKILLSVIRISINLLIYTFIL